MQKVVKIKVCRFVSSLESRKSPKIQPEFLVAVTLITAVGVYICRKIGRRQTVQNPAVRVQGRKH